MSKTGTGAVVMTAAVVTVMGRRGVRSSSSETAGTGLGEEGQGYRIALANLEGGPRVQVLLDQGVGGG